MRQVCEKLTAIVGAVGVQRSTGKSRSAVAYSRVLMCIVLFAALLCSSPQLLRAQQGAATPKRLPSAEKIVDSYLKAIGGKKRVAGIRDATYEWQIHLKDRTMGIARTQTKTPSSVRAELIFGNGQIVSAANARSAWTHGLDGKLHTLTDAEAAAARLQAVLDASHLLDVRKSNVLSRVTSSRTAEPAYVVEFSLRSGARLRYLFSPTTKLLIGIEDDARKTITHFEDYRSEGKILEPHRVNIDNGGTGELTFVLQRVSYNTGIADSIFDPPRGTEVLDVPALLRDVSRNQDQLEQRFTEYSRRAERQKQISARAKKGEDDDVDISQFLKIHEFVSPRRERFRDRDAVVFDFRPRPGFKPSNRAEDLISKLVGVAWIDPVDKQVMRLEARLAEGFKMAGGLLVNLRPGAAFVMEQTRMVEGIWLPRLAQINLSVKVLLFGGGDYNQTIEWSDYKHFSGDVGDYKLDAPKSEPLKADTRPVKNP